MFTLYEIEMYALFDRHNKLFFVPNGGAQAAKTPVGSDRIDMLEKP
jgi:hypothetical protein